MDIPRPYMASMQPQHTAKGCTACRHTIFLLVCSILHAAVCTASSMSQGPAESRLLSATDHPLEQQQLHVGLQRQGRQLLANRVGSVGVGVFIILLFMVFYILSAVAFAIVFGVLAGSPKGQAPPKPEWGYDQTIVPLGVVMTLLILGVMMAGVGMLVFQAAPQVYARPLSYHTDVLQGAGS